MQNYTVENWSFCIRCWRQVDLCLPIQLPLFALVVFLAGFAQPWVTMSAVIVLVASVALHELARIVTASRVGGHANALVLGPVGGWTKLHLPVDPPAHLITALVGPLTFFILMVTAGCGLALAGDRHVLQILLHPFAPPIDVSYNASVFHTTGQLVVWINWCLFLISLLPIDPCAGAELLRGVLWPIVGRATATSATSHLALATGVFLALAALIVFRQDSSTTLSGNLVPAWFPLATASIFLLYGGSRTSIVRRYDIEEFDSDDEDWLANEWIEDDCEAVLVEHLQDKQQEALDRKRREREANEDARVDAILLRLRNSTFEQLLEEERATLKRASRRYRERRNRLGNDE